MCVYWPTNSHSRQRPGGWSTFIAYLLLYLTFIAYLLLYLLSTVRTYYFTYFLLTYWPTNWRAGRGRQRDGPKIPRLVLHLRHRRKGRYDGDAQSVRGRRPRPPLWKAPNKALLSLSLSLTHTLSLFLSLSSSLSLALSLSLSQTVHPALARRWFRAAAAQGDVTSEFCMGFCWYDGGWITLIAYLLLYFLSTDLTFFAHFFLLYVRYL
jgi:hypothetical protein